MSDLDAPPSPPGRVEVAVQWQALAQGEVTREAVHAWARPWVEGEAALADFEDPLVVTALQYLHGFDLCQASGGPGVVWHGASGEGEWCHSLDAITGELTRWQEKCALYDADPQGWTQKVREQARAFIQAEEEERRRRPC
ncbi:hypothetical protein [Streptomyces sp. NRRL S-1824]|uniref:hypothetical protein n=1 Tax=Streptomyces sp. NRRL S-1824 TaxID=1463889 RepID=UPI00131AD51D|nr:hypothetical protein [Streptomyces sp. NRRL S-1824]